ncbi:gfo/Idh/MocA family oxidoreductase [Trinickia dabaoshanensis]|uniref:Gfo/Idh/MocA family oxidoreductase n=1 Tax=Trinickia dabaoshanensis TaxID=564714 RepID=A0A2N7VFD7_9BURK|nr:Gfo/Idh/MocA family oxidoreductase [Trinickia dabaoshanensis]PMS15869.1 gfo/Idh/MocA family oxidoreductase [Trinickia dabaoshanensis]
MRMLIVGYGSIGARHGRIAASLGIEVACVSRNEACPHPRFGSIAEALERFMPERVLIANPTAQHADALRALREAGFAGAVLIEKPIFDALDALPETGNMRIYTAYNLRFHPLVQALRARVAGRPLFCANFQAGQYLPQWRPATDYRQSYSASKSMGGGVLRDLSHEIDLALWLCGPAVRVAALGGHFSDLEIDSDDVFSMLSVNARCPAVSVAINYLDRKPHRTITLNGPELSAALDLVAGELTVNGETTQLTPERDVTYRAQLEAFASDDVTTLATLAEGIDVVRFVDAAEAAAATGSWIQP